MILLRTFGSVPLQTDLGYADRPIYLYPHHSGTHHEILVP